MSTVDLEDVIVSAVEDSVSEEPTETVPEVEAPTPDATEATPEASDSTTPDSEAPDTESTEVSSPAVKAAAQTPTPEQDDFEKQFGIPKESSPGRENRIPHSRVVKIVGKAVANAKAEFAPKITEYEAKLKDFEVKDAKRIDLETKVQNFEKSMIEDKPKFLARLRNIPGYAELLDAKPSTPVLAPSTPDATPDSGEPQPDQELSDGSRVYSLEGLSKLNTWNREQARKETLAEVEKIYGPIAQNYQEQEKQRQFEKYQQEVLYPAIQAQIQEASTWPLFKDNEDAITKILSENPKFSLERAYQTVVLPLLQANKDSVRKQVLAELKKAPLATSAPSGSTKASAAPVKSGPRDLEEVIREAAAGLPR